MKILLTDEGYAFLLTAEDGQESLVQTDWDYAGLALSFGWSPCDCDDAGSTDGTVDCPCGRTVSDMLSDAHDFLIEHDGDEIDDPGYFNEKSSRPLF